MAGFKVFDECIVTDDQAFVNAVGNNTIEIQGEEVGSYIEHSQILLV